VPASLDHRGERRAYGAPLAEQVDVHSSLELRRIDHQDRVRRRRDPCIGDDDVDRAEVLHGGVRGTLEHREVRHVGLERRRALPEALGELL
jgi:hypothetical protein